MPHGCGISTGGSLQPQALLEEQGADALGMSLGFAILAADAMNLRDTRAALAAALRCLDAEAAAAPGPDWVPPRVRAKR